MTERSTTFYRTSTPETILVSPGTVATCTDDRRGKHDRGVELMNLRYIRIEWNSYSCIVL